MPALASLSQADLDALAAEQAAQDAVATPPPSEPPDPGANDPTYVPPPVGPPPQPAYVATDLGYTPYVPGPQPQPAYIPTTQSAPAAPLPQSPSMAGPLEPPPTPPTGPPTGPQDFAPPQGNDKVVTTYPASGDPSTYRTIPPMGSHYPSAEYPVAPPPPDRSVLPMLAQQHQMWPDVAVLQLGDATGLRGGTPPPIYQRYVPETTIDKTKRMFFRGEGNMGYHDPLATPTQQNLPRPTLGSYWLAPGETTPYTTFVPGTGSPYTPQQEADARARAAARGEAGHVAPPGYVPEMWQTNRTGPHSYSSYWLAQAPDPQVVPLQTERVMVPGPPPRQPWQGEGPLGQHAPAMSWQQLFLEMDQARRERGLRGLFGGGPVPWQRGMPIYDGGTPKE